LNSKSTQVFCLNTHTQAVPTLEAVLVSQPQPQGRLPTCTFFLLFESALSSIIIKSAEAGVTFSVIKAISQATLSCIAFTSEVPKLKASIVSKAICVEVSVQLRFQVNQAASTVIISAGCQLVAKSVRSACNQLQPEVQPPQLTLDSLKS
jgi:hypothetical protein